MSLSRTKIRFLALIAVFALVVAACGGGGEANSGVATLENPDAAETLAAPEDPTTGGDNEVATQEQDREEALIAFTQCLRDNGVDIEDPTVDANGNLQITRPGGQGGGGGGGGGAGNDNFREAREACQDLLDGVALGFGGGADLTELQDDLLEFAQCMRDNGYDMQDPDLTNFGPGAGGGGGPFGDIDRDDPAFEAASEVCQDILAGFGRLGGGGGRPGGGAGNG